MSAEIKIYQRRFGAYVRNYLSGLIPPELRGMAALKVVHTQRVRAEMKRLGGRIGLDKRPLFLAELAGLFHDIGRFEQLRRFGTFEDARSVDHAAFSAEVCLENSFLKELAGAECRLVITAIRRHNMKTVPPASSFLESVLTMLLRDADKLDIWRVFNDHYCRQGRETGQDDSVLVLGRPDTPGISPQVAADIMAGRIVDIASVKNRNDFALARLAWVFDINFVPTLEEISRRGYVQSLRDSLPEFDEKDQLFQRVGQYIDDMIATKTPAC